jgi:His-Xaa-Ser system protein HxsD
MFENIQLWEVFAHDEKTASFLVDIEIFSVDIIMKTLFLFLDTCYVFLLKERDGLYVQIVKKDSYKWKVETLIWDISNELLNTLLREKITQENTKIREEIVTRALWYSLHQAAITEEVIPQNVSTKSIDDLLKELDTEFNIQTP